MAVLLKETIIQLIQEGYCYFGAGGGFDAKSDIVFTCNAGGFDAKSDIVFACNAGALGFDMLAAQTVLHLKTVYPHIKLILVLPCNTQTKGWKREDIIRYQEIKRNADKVVYTSFTYYAGCMQKRNRHLVDHSSVCVCYFTGVCGGTCHTVNYAKDQRLRVLNIADPLASPTHS